METERLILRPFVRKDAKAIVSAVNHKDVAMFTRIPHPYHLQDAYDFIKKTKKEDKDDRAYVLGIFLKKELIGAIGIHNLNWDDQRGDLGYWLTPKHWKQGYMREAALAFVKYVFNDLHFNRIEIEMSLKNKDSINLAKWLGAKKEGLLRKRCVSDTCRHDVYLYGLLREDFDAQHF